MTREVPPPIPLNERRVLFIDVMIGDMFLFTMRYNHRPTFDLDLEDIYNKVVERKPSLRYKKFDVYID